MITNSLQLFFLLSAFPALADMRLGALQPSEQPLSITSIIAHSIVNGQFWGKGTMFDSTSEQIPDQPSGSLNPKLPLLSLNQIRRLVRDAPDEAVAGEIRLRGIDFKCKLLLVDELNLTGAGPQTVEILRSLVSNRPPSVDISAGKAEVEQGANLTLLANAHDPDNDELELFWSSTAGSLEGKGREARLNTSNIALDSDSINLTITVAVNDRKGGTDSKSVTVIVRRQELIKTWRDAEYIMISIAGKYNEAVSKKGSVEVELNMVGGATDMAYMMGALPSLPCTINFVAQDDNVAEYSIKELPRVDNNWNKVTIQLLLRDQRQVVRFAINWQLIEVSPRQ